MNGYTVSVEEKYALDSNSRTMQVKKIKKPGFFKRWLLNSVKDAINEEQAQHSNQASDTIRSSTGLVIERTSLESQPMHLKIYRANGGTVVETTSYDRQKDRHQNQLHIIGHNTDLGEGLSKIITMESLRG